MQISPLEIPNLKNVDVTEAVEEVDPVYSFLKLTSGIPRDGARIIPGDDHYCCSKTDQDIGMAADGAAGLQFSALS